MYDIRTIKYPLESWLIKVYFKFLNSWSYYDGYKSISVYVFQSFLQYLKKKEWNILMLLDKPAILNFIAKPVKNFDDNFFQIGPDLS